VITDYSVQREAANCRVVRLKKAADSIAYRVALGDAALASSQATSRIQDGRERVRVFLNHLEAVSLLTNAVLIDESVGSGVPVMLQSKRSQHTMKSCNWEEKAFRLHLQ
jgi:hypothetical protein